MKIFCTDYEQLGLREGTSDEVDATGAWTGRRIQESDLYMKPDSALLNSGKLLYKPNHIERLSVSPQLIVRIAKVGRALQPQFAHRYYSEAAIGLSFYGPEEWQRCYDQRLDSTLTTGFDGALMRSEFMPIDKMQRQTITMVRAGASYALTLPHHDILIETIVMLSGYFLLKMGDLICFPLSGRYMPIEMEEDLVILQDGETTLFTGIR